ncbi:MAG: hypothetical protein IJA32_06625 [Lachnospiraceae bacterium]|nr:hypothetical protein [Lachnospiraceae bacterium]
MARKNFIREKRIYCGERWLEVDIIPVTNIPETGKVKEKASSLKQQNLNDKNSKRRFVQIANANFTEADYHLSATYNDKYMPETLEDAERIVRNYLNRIKRKMKKDKGVDLKYMLVTEFTPMDPEEGDTGEGTKAVRIHHHIIINGALSREEVELLWSTTRINWKKASDPTYRQEVDFLGFANCDRLQPNENGIEGLVNYINKRKKGCKKWSASQNLEKPKIKKNDHKYSVRTLKEYAKTPEDKEVWRKRYPGYEPTSINFQYNDYTGWSIYLRLKRLRN